jgi:hypothetical protein
MQAPHLPVTAQPTADDIIFCPKCNMNLFAPLSVYAVTKNNLIGEQQALSQSLTAIQCCECQTILPLSQLSEFTKAQLEKSAKTPQELLEDDKKEKSAVQ